MSFKKLILNKLKLNKLRLNKGSAAVLLSFMVSVGVLGTVYITQKMMGGFLSDLSQVMEEWEKHLVTESAQTLGAYLVSNNLVLCREKGWTGKQSKCRWNKEGKKAKAPSHFSLSDEMDSTEGLFYAGKYKVNKSEREYKVRFSLVDWRDTPVENLVGEVPEAVCIDKNTFGVVKDGTCVDYTVSASPIDQACQVNGVEDPNTLCQYLKPVDGDYSIVMIKVEVDYKDPVSGKDLKHIALSGIRRPLSSIKFGVVISGRKCSAACPTGNVVNAFPSCRGENVPMEAGNYTGKASNIVSVTNQGPGAIYSLSLMRTAVQLTGPQNKYTIDVTEDIVAQGGKEEVFLPGQTIRFEYFYDCPIEVRHTTVHKTGDQDKVEVTSSTRDIPYEKFYYGLNLDEQKPVGVCYKGSGVPLSATDNSLADFVLVNNQRIPAATCGKGATACSAGGKTGACQFVGLEPRRIFTAPTKAEASHNSLVKEVVTTVYSQPPPPPTFSGGDGGGPDGTDGAGCCAP